MVPAWLSVPPAADGLQICANSKRELGGNPRPSGCGTRPVALHTALISIADLVPSTKELNIFGLMLLRSWIFKYSSRISHTLSGVD